jgi:acyl carrier protein
MATKNIKNIEDTVKKVFLKIFSSELKSGSFDFKKTQDKFQNWDSFSHMELVSEMENEFGVNLEMEEIISIRSPQDFVNLIKRKTKR